MGWGTHLALGGLLGHGLFLRLSFTFVAVVLKPDLHLKQEKTTQTLTSQSTPNVEFSAPAVVEGDQRYLIMGDGRSYIPRSSRGNQSTTQGT